MIRTTALPALAVLLSAADAQPSAESIFITRFIEEHHDDLAPMLRAHYVAHGVPSHRLRETIQDTLMWEAECSLDSINSYGDGYQELLLARVQAGDSVTEARYAAQDALEREMANSAYGPNELENRLKGSHARFARCMNERLSARNLPPLPPAGPQPG